jgi:hypothetical protein
MTCIDFDACKSKKCKKCQRNARIRVCASCERVYIKKGPTGCPTCGFASYGAYFVFGNWIKILYKLLTKSHRRSAYES